MKAIISLVDANIAIFGLSNERKEALKRLLYSLDQYTNGSLSPDEMNDYEKIKEVLIKRHSQHEENIS